MTTLDRVAENIKCPVCGSHTDRSEKAPGWGEWRRCSECTLEFVYPLHRDEDSKTFFDDAYQGKIRQSAMRDFKMRVDKRHVIIDQLNDPSLWFWTPAFQDMLSWIRQHMEPGSTVLELGCGLGFFLHALRREGFHAVGLDVARTVVDLNRRDGFDVWHGTLDSMPAGWVDPKVVVSLFMLHHLEEPLQFLRTIRERWPNSPLVLAVYGPSNKGDLSSSPPRTLIRWNSEALASALIRAGYEPAIRTIPSTATDADYYQPIRKLLGRTMRLPWIYRLGKEIEARVLPKLASLQQRDAFVVVAYAEPTRINS